MIWFRNLTYALTVGVFDVCRVNAPHPYSGPISLRAPSTPAGTLSNDSWNVRFKEGFVTFYAVQHLIAKLIGGFHLRTLIGLADSLPSLFASLDVEEALLIHVILSAINHSAQFER